MWVCRWGGDRGNKGDAVSGSGNVNCRCNMLCNVGELFGHRVKPNNCQYIDGTLFLIYTYFKKCEGSMPSPFIQRENPIQALRYSDVYEKNMIG